MKSLHKAIRRDNAGQLSAWSPTDIYSEPENPEMDQISTKIHELFSLPELVKEEQKPKTHAPNLHPAELGKEYSKWLPGDKTWEVAPANKEDWSFIDTGKEGFYNLDQELVELNFEEEDDDVVLEKTVKMMIEEQAQLIAKQNEEERIKRETETEEILKQARAQAEEIILAGHAAVDNAMQVALEEIEVQKQEGYNQGYNEARIAFQSSIKAAQVLVAEVQAWQKELTAQGEKVLVEMVKDISNAMFGEGARLDSNALQINLNRILENAQGLGDLNIFLNPRDARLLDPSWSEYQFLVSGNRVKIIPSENITPGGCFVKGSMGTVDGRVETQLAAIMKSFEEDQEANE